MTVHYQNAAGRFRLQARPGDPHGAVPGPAPRRDRSSRSPRPKQRAIRQLHYDASAKIFLQFRRRFWEEDDGIFGGGTVTDLPIRTVYYPDHGRETGRGVLLASYTWAEDAQRWGSLSPARPHRPGARERLLHPSAGAPTSSRSARRRCGTTTSSRAALSRCSTPASRPCSTQHIVAPEGRIHFAGEHASLGHAWIQGAIESGLRAAIEVAERSRGRGAVDSNRGR